MAIKEEFEIRISKNGEMRIIAKGFNGQECEIPLKNLRKMMNAEGQIIEHTSEYYSAGTDVEAKIREK